MTQNGVHETEHRITVGAPADVVYDLIADVRNWPRIFPPTIHVDRTDLGSQQERIRVWATANGEPKTWTSRRVLDPDGRRITFRQEVSTPPVAAMGGVWTVEPLSPDRARIVLTHDYRAVNDDPAGLEWIDRAVDGNSRSELAALKENVEAAHAARDLTFSFEDTVRIAGPAEDVYDFINEADRWTERLPHVSHVRLDEDAPGLQTLEMDTKAKDGSVHTTRSHRVCLPHHLIAYKQVTLPPLMRLHTGLWTFVPGEGEVAATSQHTVVLNPDNIAGLLGADASVEDARNYVRDALSTNSRATLGHAKDHAERER
ncbi:aromatase/cyclase [Streptomyces sp. NPDC059740]|uniref:aromatase/cyclase n=1 Tax=Streptomyces sp. NPDC059740 TaxID=3346926 RepID=UPI003648FD57